MQNQTEAFVNFTDYEFDDNCQYNFSDYEHGIPRTYNCFYWDDLAPPLVVYSLSLILGLAGNALIVFTTCRYRRMKSTTNVFLASLACADLVLIIICIPVKVAKLFSYTWTMGYFLCKSVHYLQVVVAICSVLTLTAISVERYYAIVHPMKAKYICTISQAKKIIMTTWIASIILATPNLAIQKHYRVGHESMDLYYCTVDFDNTPSWQLYSVYTLFLIFVIPTVVMLVTYSTICWEICRVMKQRHNMVSGRAVLRKENIPLTNKSQNGFVTSPPPPPSDDKGNVKQVIKMLVLIVVVFILCWAPILVLDCMAAFGAYPMLPTGLFKHIKTTFQLMAYFNSCVNPIIYGFMSKNFRESFQKALSRCCRQHLRRQLSVSHSRGTSIRFRDRSTTTVTQVTSN